MTICYIGICQNVIHRKLWKLYQSTDWHSLKYFIVMTIRKKSCMSKLVYFSQSVKRTSVRKKFVKEFVNVDKFTIAKLKNDNFWRLMLCRACNFRLIFRLVSSFNLIRYNHRWINFWTIWRLVKGLIRVISYIGVWRLIIVYKIIKMVEQKKQLYVVA